MSKTIESKLREIKRKEQKLENQRKKLEQRRNQLEIEKHQEEVHHKKYEPYLEQFKELDLQFEYKQGNIQLSHLISKTMNISHSFILKNLKRPNIY